MQPGQVIAELAVKGKGGKPNRYRIHFVKSVRANGSVVLLRATHGSSAESTTTAGFAAAVESGKLEGWYTVNTEAIDIIATNIINSGGQAVVEGSNAD